MLLLPLSWFFGVLKFFYQIFHQFHHFGCKLYRIIVTCYIIDKKTNNFTKSSSFAITIAVATYNSLRSYVSSIFASSIVYLLSITCPLRLYFPCFGELFILSTSSMACSVCILCSLLHLYLLIVLCQLYLYLLCIGELSASYVSFMVYFVCIFYLCLFCFIYIYFYRFFISYLLYLYLL